MGSRTAPPARLRAAELSRSSDGGTGLGAGNERERRPVFHSPVHPIPLQCKKCGNSHRHIHPMVSRFSQIAPGSRSDIFDGSLKPLGAEKVFDNVYKSSGNIQTQCNVSRSLGHVTSFH